jgi:SAM-dependent methyltransferase
MSEKFQVESETMPPQGAVAQMYSLIAEQIINKTRIETGICIDVGTGPAPLSAALTDITELRIYAVDLSEDRCRLAKENIHEMELEDRIKVVRSDVHSLAFPDGFADLVVSRGSMFFWKDLSQAFKEICRVLKPEGMAYIGGGYGSSQLKDKIKQGKEPSEKHLNIPRLNIDHVNESLKKAEIKDFEIINDDSGLWIVIKR